MEKLDECRIIPENKISLATQLQNLPKDLAISVCTFGVLGEPSFLNSFFLFKEFADTPKG